MDKRIKFKLGANFPAPHVIMESFDEITRLQGLLDSACQVIAANDLFFKASLPLELFHYWVIRSAALTKLSRVNSGAVQKPQPKRKRK